MIVDLKYHIASLVAVFLALAVGILIGSAMLGDDTMAEGQKQLVDRVEERLNLVMKENKETREENHRLQALVKAEENFNKQVLPILIKGRLTGKVVAVIATNENEIPETMVETLKLAGANVVSVTTIRDSYETALTDKRAETAAVFGQKDQTQATLAGTLGNLVTDALLNGPKSASWQQVSQLKLLDTQGQYGVPFDTVILVGGSKDKEDLFAGSVDLPLARAFRQKGIKVLGTEESDVPVSYIRNYQSEKIATVDNIDTIPGRVALVYSVAGKTGHYGIKNTARDLVPAMP